MLYIKIVIVYECNVNIKHSIHVVDITQGIVYLK